MTDAPRSGLALEELSAEIRPQDDLFRHVNGAWLDRTEIPEDKARFAGNKIDMRDRQLAGDTLILRDHSSAAPRECRTPYRRHPMRGAFEPGPPSKR